MIAAETLAMLRGVPHREGQFVVDLGTAEDIDTVRLSRNGHDHEIVVHRPRPLGSTYLSIDPGTGAVTTVVAGVVVYRGDPDPGLVRLLAVGRGWGKTRLARADRRAAMIIRSKTMIGVVELDAVPHVRDLGEPAEAENEFRQRVSAARYPWPRHGTIACPCIFCGDPDRLARERSELLGAMLARGKALAAREIDAALDQINDIAEAAGAYLDSIGGMCGVPRDVLYGHEPGGLGNSGEAAAYYERVFGRRREQ